MAAAGPHTGCCGNPSHMCSVLGGARSCGGAGGKTPPFGAKRPSCPPHPTPGPSSAQFTGLATEQLFSLGRREEDRDSAQPSASSLRGGWPGGGAVLGSEISDCTQALRNHVVDQSRGEPASESVLEAQHSTEWAVRGTRIRKQ